MLQTLSQKTMILTLDEVKNLKKHPRNRTVREQQVKKIYKAMERGEIVFPIILNRKTMRVLDGQHRREAWLRYTAAHPEEKNPMLEVVSIDIPEEKEFGTIIKANSETVKWNPADYINAYADGGNIHYIRLRDFMKRCRFCHSIQENPDSKTIYYPKITNAIGLLGCNASSKTSVYKNGEFEVTEDEIQVAETRVAQIETVLKVLDPNNTAATRTITYLIDAWIAREDQDLGLSAERRLAYMQANKRAILRRIKDSENRLQKASDWTAIFDYIANAMYAEQHRGGSELSA